MEQIKGVVSEYKPWNRDLPCWIVAVEGAIAAAIGIYFVVAPDAANSTIRLLLAGLLVVSSAFDIWTGFRNSGEQPVRLPMAPYQLVRGGAGVTLGLLYFSQPARTT